VEVEVLGVLIPAEVREHLAGLVLGLENHGGIVATADGLLEIVRAVRSPWFGETLDTGNFHAADPYAELVRCVPYAVNDRRNATLHGGHGAAAGDPRVPRTAA
jgi:sugar phosphate isomerase/epimerase